MVRPVLLQGPLGTCWVCLQSPETCGCSGTGNIPASFQFLLDSPQFRVVLDITPWFDVVQLRGAEHCCADPLWWWLLSPEGSPGPSHTECCLMVALFIHSTVFIFTGLVMDAGKLARRQDGKKRVILCPSAISTLSPRGKLLGQGFSFFS